MNKPDHVEVVLDRLEWLHAMTKGAERASFRLESKHAKFYDPSRMEPDVLADQLAAVGEYAVAKLLGHPWTAGANWPAELHGLFRHLPDVGDGNSASVEVKRIRSLEHRLFPVDPGNAGQAIFVVHPEPPKYRTVLVLGWARADDALQVAKRAIPGVDRLFAPLTLLTLEGIRRPLEVAA